MDVAAHEAALKKKLQVFLSDLQHMGTVAGFKHFSSYVRGREEIVLAIKNSLQSGEFSLPASRRQSLCPGESLTSSQLPYEKGSLVLSHNTQLGLSGRRERGIGLPPASPSEQENESDRDTTLFLVAGYARYSCPYVWVRSNHERLFKLSGDEDSDRDSPLRLKSTAKWKDGDVQASDIVSELVRLCTYPSPRNPFEVDLEFFQSLPQPEQLLASAAMVSLLQKIVIHTSDSKAYAGKVSDDLQHMSRLHFHGLRDLTEAQSLPVLKQPQQQSQQQHRQQRPTHNFRQQKQQQHRQLQQPPQPPSSSSKAAVKVPQQQQQQQYRQPVPQQPQPQPPPPMTTQQQQQQYRQPVPQQPQPPPMTAMQQQQQFRHPPPQQPPAQTAVLSQQQQQQQNRHPQLTQQQQLFRRPPPPVQNSPHHPNMMKPQDAGEIAQGGFKPPPSGGGYSHPQVRTAQPSPQQPEPTNPNAGRVYGRGPRGAFPGGFDRMPAPSMF